MKEIDMLKDLLQYRRSNQVFYNESLVNVVNPEARQVFTQLRDDEMRGIIELERKIEKLIADPGIIGKIFGGR